MLTFIVKNDLTTTLKSLMPAATSISPVVSSADSVETLVQKKLFWSYPKAFFYVLNEFANDEATAKMNSIILCWTKPASVSSMKYGDDLYKKSCKVAKD